MRILITNDDGIHSPGLEAIRRALESDHEVWVLAPDSERSAMSHYITVKDPVSCKQLDERTYISNGSPADCVIIGMLGALPITPEIVISGINIGANLGSDIIYSGTAAAARQAAIMGVPGFALSLDGFRDPLHFEPFAEFAADNLDEFVGLWNSEHFININSPNTPDGGKEVVITSPAVRFYNDKLASFKAPSGEMYYFLDGTPAQTELQPGTDWHAVAEGKISVSPIYLNPINHRDELGYRSASFLTSGVSRT